MVKVTRRKAPSRVRYEQSHPTISCRVPLEIYQKLQAVKKAEDRSFTDILRIGLGQLEVKVSQEKEARQQGYKKGYNDGYKRAAALYMVSYPCKKCGKMIAVTDNNEKEAIKTYMLEHKWSHSECSDR